MGQHGGHGCGAWGHEHVAEANIRTWSKNEEWCGVKNKRAKIRGGSSNQHHARGGEEGKDDRVKVETLVGMEGKEQMAGGRKAGVGLRNLASWIRT